MSDMLQLSCEAQLYSSISEPTNTQLPTPAEVRSTPQRTSPSVWRDKAHCVEVQSPTSKVQSSTSLKFDIGNRTLDFGHWTLDFDACAPRNTWPIKWKMENEKWKMTNDWFYPRMIPLPPPVITSLPCWLVHFHSVTMFRKPSPCSAEVSVTTHSIVSPAKTGR